MNSPFFFFCVFIKNILESTEDIGDIEIKDNNNALIENIPVRLLKRKIDLNQSGITILQLSIVLYRDHFLYF
jgi:hypothetical protein